MSKSNIHFVKLPDKYRNEHYQEWLKMAVWRLLMVTKLQPDKEQISELKSDTLKSTRVQMCTDTETNFHKLSKTVNLNKIDTFLYVFLHIETHPSIYFQKCNVA